MGLQLWEGELQRPLVNALTGRAAVTNTGIPEASGQIGPKSANCCERVNGGDGLFATCPSPAQRERSSNPGEDWRERTWAHRRSQPDEVIPKCLRRPPAASRPACPRSAIEFTVDLTDQTEPCFPLYPS